MTFVFRTDAGTLGISKVTKIQVLYSGFSESHGSDEPDGFFCSLVVLDLFVPCSDEFGA
jgi:hypothetical protein